MKDNYGMRGDVEKKDSRIFSIEGCNLPQPKLFLIFFENGTFSGLLLISERVDGGHTIAKDLRKAIFKKNQNRGLNPIRLYVSITKSK